MKKVVKRFLAVLLGIFGKAHLIEYWAIRRNESTGISKITSFYKGFIRPDMKVLDIGANIGHYSRVFLNLGAQVVAIEPLAYCQQILKKRFSDNPRFKLFPVALGSKPGEVEIRISESHTISSANSNWIDAVSSSQRFTNEHWTKTEVVTVITADEVISRSGIPDYVKIDVEGYEVEVLKGLSVPIQYISFEVTLPETLHLAQECLTRIEALARYEFVIPETDELVRETNWRSFDEMRVHLSTLAHQGNKLSADVFCRRKN